MSYADEGKGNCSIMARPKEFEEREALTAALKLFWRKGYSQTSLHDLTEAMQISRQSLYDTFGDKHALYLQAMSHYMNTSYSQAWARPLLSDGDARSTIRQAFENIIAETMADSEAAGCFIINAGAEMGASDEEVRSSFLTATAATESLFEAVIAQGQARDEIMAQMNARAMAAYFMNAARGLRLLARMRPQRADIQAIVDVTLTVLD
jgi:TetR/AcrR family transcriptional regulator, transcriptional repressor for nem operon